MLVNRLLLSCACIAVLEAREPAVVEHVKVYSEPGRFGGWPANHGIWSWGNEILVGFSAAWFKTTSPDRHPMDSTKPEEPRFARSLDGGQTWTIETPREILPPAQGGRQPVALETPMSFKQPGFAMTIRFLNNHTGPSLLWFTSDKGHTWKGPYTFPMFG